MSQDRKLAMVKNLLALTKSADVHEAANAAAMAQTIIDKYKIDVALLQDGDPDAQPIQCCTDFPLFTTKGGIPIWKWDLIWALGQANGCVPWSSYEPDGDGKYHRVFYVVGKTSDAQTVQYLHQYLCAEINRFAKQHRGKGRIWLENFRLGAVAEISERLEEQQRSDRKALKRSARKEVKEGNPAALVNVNNALSRIAEQSALVEKWMEEHELTHGQDHDVDDEYESPAAYEAGRDLGAAVSLGGNKTLALGPGT